jgi:hypothetical protein
VISFLKSEQVAEGMVEPYHPEMRVGLGIDQLDIDANLVARPLDASLQYMAYAELAADLLGVDRFCPDR